MIIQDTNTRNWIEWIDFYKWDRHPHCNYWELRLYAFLGWLARGLFFLSYAIVFYCQLRSHKMVQFQRSLFAATEKVSHSFVDLGSNHLHIPYYLACICELAWLLKFTWWNTEHSPYSLAAVIKLLLPRWRLQLLEFLSSCLFCLLDGSYLITRKWSFPVFCLLWHHWQ